MATQQQDNSNSSADPRFVRAKALHDYLHPLAKNNAFKTPVSEIEPGLFLGGHWKPNFPTVDVILNVSDKFGDGPNIVTPPNSPGGTVLVWMPINDYGPYPGISWLEMAVGVVEKAREQQMAILVHCEAGQSRSAMVLTAYMMKRDGLSVDDALNYILRKRAIAPRPEFLVGLQDYENFLKGSTENEGATSGVDGLDMAQRGRNSYD